MSIRTVKNGDEKGRGGELVRLRHAMVLYTNSSRVETCDGIASSSRLEACDGIASSSRLEAPTLAGLRHAVRAGEGYDGGRERAREARRRVVARSGGR